MGAEKRKTGEAHSGKPAKKPRNGEISSIVAALESSSLPRSCCEMLGIMADTSLSMPSDERTPYDCKAVELIEASLEALHGQYIAEADEIFKAKEAAELARTDAEAGYKIVQAAAAGAEAKTSTLKHSLADVYEEFATKRDALAALKLETSKQMETVTAYEEERELLRTGSIALIALKDESFEAIEAPNCLANLEVALAKCEIEESLRLA
eukprot:4680087-Amphidinium_carterae.1